MRAGRLRHRIIMERAVPVTTDGSTVTTWQPLGTDGKNWGAVEPIRGREALIAGATLAEMDTRIILRYNSLSATLTARDRISYAGVIYNLQSIVEVRTARREIEFLAKSGLNNG